MDDDVDPEEIGKRFHRPSVPTLALGSGLREPFVFSHVVSDVAMPAPTFAPPVADTFALHVHHAPISRGDIWTPDGHVALPPVPDGGVFIWDLRGQPIAQIHEGFEFSRFELPRAALDDLAYERGIRRPGDLHAPIGRADPVLKHLALAMIHGTVLHGQDRDTLFTDGIALALFAHVVRAYGNASLPAGRVGLLPPWQVRQLTEWVDAHMADTISVADLAGLLGLSRSYFSRSFVKTFGAPPHQWLLLRRIERAKQLLKGSTRSLSDVAAACGFVDQSHFTNVFTRIERVAPGRWRREAT